MSRKTALLIMLVFALTACASRSTAPVELDVGLAQADVRALLGEPDRLQEFDLPDEPFFGPQESLTGLVEPGTPILEWVYLEGNEERYVWFSADAESDFRVIAFATYPADAVF